MTDQYLIEAGVDNYLLEDASGQLLIDQRVEVVGSSTVGVTESTNKSWLKVIVNNLGLTDVANTAKGFVKNTVLATLGLTESKNYQQTQYDYLHEDGLGFGYLLEDSSGIYIQDYPFKVAVTSNVGVTEASQKVTGFVKQFAETLGLTDTINYVTGFFKVATQFVVAAESVLNYILTEVNFYGLEDGTGHYQPEDGAGGYLLDQLQILKYAAATLGLTEASQKLTGPIKYISDTVGLTFAANRAMVMYRNTTLSTIGLTEALNRIGTLKRNLASTVGITETINRLGVIKRNLTSTVGLTGVNNYIRGLARTLTSTVGVTESILDITGIVKEALETIGITEVATKIRSVFISTNIGDFIVMASVTFNNFFVVDSYNNEDMTGVDSYNTGNLIIRDDD